MKYKNLIIMQYGQKRELPWWLSFKESAFPVQEMQVSSLSWEGPLEKGMETHSSVLAWQISWTEVPGRQQSMRSQRVGHDLVTKHNNVQRVFKIV